MSGNDVQVAVIGFGPSGAVAASLLGQAGLRTLAIDRTREIYPKPRAMAIDHEILRMFDNLGVADAVLPFVEPFTASEHYGAEGQLIRRVDMVPPPYPMAYTPSMVFTQPKVEAVLRAHAASWPGVEVALGTELLGLSQDADGVVLQLCQDDATLRTVSADYVIGCDGASSLVRQQIGVTLDDLVFDEPWLVIDLMVHDAALGKLPATAVQYCEPARPTTYLQGPGNHRRWEIMLLPGEDRFAMEQPENAWRLLQRWLGPDDAVMWRATSYRFHALVAHDWHRGRVFLAGDAAHQQPPFIGQGMCQGLRDVSNLAWKLARVLHGKSDPSLLETYGAERGAHVRELTGRIKAIGHVICERDPEQARLRDARILAEGGGKPRTITRQEIVPPLTCGLLSAETPPAVGTLFPQPWIVGGPAPRRMDTLCGAGWRLVADGRAAVSDIARVATAELRLIVVGGSQPDSITEQDGVVAAWFDRHGVGYALVRPDHYVFGTATDEDGLARLLQELLARPH